MLIEVINLCAMAIMLCVIISSIYDNVADLIKLYHRGKLIGFKEQGIYWLMIFRLFYSVFFTIGAITTIILMIRIINKQF